MFANIATLTLNPAFDLHCNCTDFFAGCENYAPGLQRYLGGKGINVSRALSVYGVKNNAVAVLGEENADEFLKAAQQESLRVRALRVPGRIRENLTIHDPLGDETRLSFDSFFCDDSVLDAAFAAIKPNESSCVIFSGRLPGGMTKASVLAFLKRIKATGAFLAVDSNSLTARDLLELAPDLIKPNGRELTDLGFSADDEAALLKAARSLRQSGIPHVLITRGALPGYYAYDDRVYRITPAAVPAVSTIGAGDCLLAGFIAGLQSGRNTEDVLRLAFAFGSAACVLEGTVAPSPAAIDGLLSQTAVERLN